MAQYRHAAQQQDKRVYKWMIILSVAMVASLLLGLFVLNALYGRPLYYVGMYDANKPVASVGYRGERFQTGSAAQTFNDKDMVAVGQTDEGFLIYARRDELGGGGGWKPEAGRKSPESYTSAYMRTTDGKYLPIQLQGKTKSQVQ